MNNTVFTIGYSTHPLERFMALLKQYDITALCDVRSMPYSRLNPNFNREKLKQPLRDNGIVYVFLGDELGARSENHSCYIDGKVSFERLSQTDMFQRGLLRIIDGTSRYRIALMCAERDPLECHRTILIARHLSALGFSIMHILENGKLESQNDALNRLLNQLNLNASDIFRSHDEIIEAAYRTQGDRIAYKENDLITSIAQRRVQK